MSSGRVLASSDVWRLGAVGEGRMMGLKMSRNRKCLILLALSLQKIGNASVYESEGVKEQRMSMFPHNIYTEGSFRIKGLSRR